MWTEKRWMSDECQKQIVSYGDKVLQTCYDVVTTMTWSLELGYYELATTWSLRIHYNVATTNSLRHVTTARSLQTCYDAVTTICPLQSRHNRVTINSLQRWSLWVATMWSLQPGHYKCGYYNQVTTNSPRVTTNSLQPGHYKLATTPSLQPHYNLATTPSLQLCHYNLATTPSLQLCHYNLATAQSLCYNLATTILLQWWYCGNTTMMVTHYTTWQYCIIFSKQCHCLMMRAFVPCLFTPF